MIYFEKIILFLCLFLGVSFADTGSTYRYKIGKHWQEFISFERPDLLISAGCKKADAEFNCLSYSALTKAKVMKSWPAGGANPGALICKNLQGSIVRGKNERREENSFCKFSDKSMVSSAALYVFALKNAKHE